MGLVGRIRPFSKLYETRIINLHESMGEKGYPVIAINSNDAEAYPSDDFAHMQKRAKKKGFPFPYLHDESQAIAKAYGATRTPHAYLLAKEAGKFIVRYVGAIDDSARDTNEIEERYIEQAVEQLEAGEAVEAGYTKAVGCSIKWK